MQNNLVLYITVSYQNGQDSKKLKRELPHDLAISIPGIYPEKNENTNSKRYMNSNVHRCLQNSQDMKETQMSINRQMEKDDNTHTHTQLDIIQHKKNEFLPFATK